LLAGTTAAAEAAATGMLDASLKPAALGSSSRGSPGQHTAVAVGHGGVYTSSGNPVRLPAGSVAFRAMVDA
jgi:hypothetical protein